MYLIYGLLQLVSNTITWTMSPEEQAKWQFIKLAKQLPLWAWGIAFLLLTIGVMFEGSYRIHTRKIRELNEQRDASVATLQNQFADERRALVANSETERDRVAALNSQLREKEQLLVNRKRRKYLRERLGELLVKGRNCNLGIGRLEEHRAFISWVAEVQGFLSQEPEFDNSHLARFETGSIHVIPEFIKEFTD